MSEVRRRKSNKPTLATTHPFVFAQWHPEKNTVEPERVFASSKEKVWWHDPACGHDWFASPISRTTGRGCGVCAGKQIMVGVTDLASLHPDLVDEWHPTLNNGQLPTEFSPGSGKIVWWLGRECGHAWNTTVKDRVQKKTACGVCTRRFLLPGANDLATTHPELTKEWHPSKNTKTAAEYLSSSETEVWWLGEVCGHEWTNLIRNRVYEASGCLICAGKQIQVGVNDLATTHPTLAQQWHPTLNGEKTPQQISAGSHAIYWWQGLCGHEWKSETYARQINGCPICAGKQLLVGYNDLQSSYPRLAGEWHPTKNRNLTPDKTLKGSKSSVWWQCAEGHEWKGSVQGRTGNDGGCSRCTTSRPEQELYEFLSELLPKAELRRDRSVLRNRELDIYIPSLKFAIEFNGLYWHTEGKGKGSTYHHDKYQRCKDLGVTLVQIWGDDWKRDPELVKRVLAQRLSVRSDGPEARNVTSWTTAVELTKKVAEEFMNANHLRGAGGGSFQVGLVDSADKNLVAAVSLSKSLDAEGTFVYQVERFACVRPAQGALGRLLAYVTEVTGVDRFSAVTDNCEGEDNFFTEAGFTVTGEYPPAFWYSVVNVRKSVSDYSLERFREDPALVWEDGLSAEELATLNGFARIWDAGKNAWNGSRWHKARE